VGSFGETSLQRLAGIGQVANRIAAIRALSSGSRGLRGPRDRCARCRTQPRPRGARVAGRGHFPAPSVASAVAGWPSRCSVSAVPSGSPPMRRPPPPSLPSRVFLFRPGRRSDLPLLGFVVVAASLRSHPVPPPPTSPSGVHSPRLAAGSASRVPPSPLVPPSWSLTTSTVCSSGGLAGLLHPAAGPGVRRVSVAVASVRRDPGIPRRGAGRLPRDARSYPSKNVPRSQPHRVSAAVASLTFPRGLGPAARPAVSSVPSHLASAASAAFEALLRNRVRSAAPPFPAT
jgi:hypothetical protein